MRLELSPLLRMQIRTVQYMCCRMQTRTILRGQHGDSNPIPAPKPPWVGSHRVDRFACLYCLLP